MFAMARIVVDASNHASDKALFRAPIEGGIDG